MSGVHLPRWSRTKNMIFHWHRWELVQTQPYISTASLNKTSVRLLNIDHICRLKKPWGEYWACFRVHKRSPWLVENERSVRHLAREPCTLQCFCQVASAHLLRSRGDEAVDEYGRTSGRWRLSQGRDNSHYRWLNSASSALYELDMPAPWLRMDVPGRRSDPKPLWMSSEGRGVKQW